MDSETGKAGRVIAGRYRLESELDRGGMGSVWRAEHLALRAPVAIKLLDPSIGEDPEMVERFMREARAAAALRSMHVVQIFDYGLDDGVPFIAMELLLGEPLRDRLARLGRLSPWETQQIFTHVTRAVAKAHEAGVVHRDLKPDNVFLVTDDEETAKVLDFGIAKITEGRLSDSGNIETLSGRLLGTPHYMSPEQARGDAAVDHRSDLWSLAIIAFECLTGTRPFESAAVGDLILRICTEMPPVPSARADVPEGFDEWFAHGVERAPGKRFQSAREMNDALAAVLGPLPARPPRATDAVTPPRLTPDASTPATLVSEGAPQGTLPTLTERASAQDVPLPPIPVERAVIRPIYVAVGAAVALAFGGIWAITRPADTASAAPAGAPLASAAASAEPPGGGEAPHVTVSVVEHAANHVAPAGSASGDRRGRGDGRERPGVPQQVPRAAEPGAAPEHPVADKPVASAPEPRKRGDGRELFSDRE